MKPRPMDAYICLPKDATWDCTLSIDCLLDYALAVLVMQGETRTNLDLIELQEYFERFLYVDKSNVKSLRK